MKYSGGPVKNRSRTGSLNQVYDLDISEPIDFKTAHDLLGGNKQLHLSMLARMEKMSVRSCMKQITDALKINDWPTMNLGAHTLEGTSGHIGAGKLHYACYYMHKMFKMNDSQGMVHYYPLVVEACIEFKRYSRRYLCDNNGKNKNAHNQTFTTI